MRKKWKWVLLGSCLAIFAFIGYYAYSFYSFAGNIHKSPGDSRFKNTRTQPLNEDLTPPKWEGKERVNILLLGGDSRGLGDNEIPRSDSMIVVSIDPVTKKSYLFSILRDTYVKIPNNGMDRINTAIVTGGPELAMKAVGDFLGIPIQYYVYTDFKGFIALVDAVGGIDLDVEKDMKYSDAADGHQYDINLKKGYQHLNGKTALQYVRFRHDALSDFSRTERQRKFLKALAEKLQSTTSLIKLPRILQSIDPYIETNLTVTQMIKLGSLGFEVKTAGMVSEQIPPSDLREEKRIGGAEVIAAEPAKVQAFIRKLLTGESGTGGAVKTSGSGKLSLGADSGSGIEAAATASAKPKATPKPTAKATAAPVPTPKKPAAGSGGTGAGSADGTAGAADNGAKPTPKPAGPSGSDRTGAAAGGGSGAGKPAVASPAPSASGSKAASGGTVGGTARD